MLSWLAHPRPFIPEASLLSAVAGEGQEHLSDQLSCLLQVPGVGGGANLSLIHVTTGQTRFRPAIPCPCLRPSHIYTVTRVSSTVLPRQGPWPTFLNVQLVKGRNSSPVLMPPGPTFLRCLGERWGCFCSALRHQYALGSAHQGCPGGNRLLLLPGQ